MTKPSSLAAFPPLESPALRPGPLIGAGAVALDDEPAIARSQKPDNAVARTNAAVRLIDLPVERPAEASRASPTAIIRALVNGEPILDEEVKVSCAQQLMGARTQAEQREIFTQALNQLIEREVVLQDAFGRLERGGPQGVKFLGKLKELAGKEFDKQWMRRMMKANHMTSEEEFTSFMREHHLPVEVMRRLWERNFMAMEYLRSRIEPHVNRIGHTDIADYYSSHSEEFSRPDSVKWQDIFIDATRHASRAAAREFAESLVRRVQQGEDFAKLSWEFDNGTSGRFRKAEGQGRKHGEIFPPEAEPILFKMRDNNIEIVERSRGFHVVRLIEREVAGPIPFDDPKVQKEIRDKLRNTVFQREMKRIVRELRHKAVIEIASAAN